MANEKRDKNGLRLDVSVCAWCHVHYSSVTGETVDPPDDVAEGDRFSHGMCKPCDVKVRAEMSAEMDAAGILRVNPKHARDWRSEQRDPRDILARRAAAEMLAAHEAHDAERESDTPGRRDQADA